MTKANDWIAKDPMQSQFDSLMNKVKQLELRIATLERMVISDGK